MLLYNEEFILSGIRKHNGYWSCMWNDENGKKHFKLFDITIYGDEQSKLMAILYRNKMLLEVIESSF